MLVPVEKGSRNQSHLSCYRENDLGIVIERRLCHVGPQAEGAHVRDAALNFTGRGLANCSFQDPLNVGEPCT